jgi:hypothetical protein
MVEGCSCGGEMYKHQVDSPPKECAIAAICLEDSSVRRKKSRIWKNIGRLSGTSWKESKRIGSSEERQLIEQFQQICSYSSNSSFFYERVYFFIRSRSSFSHLLQRHDHGPIGDDSHFGSGAGPRGLVGMRISPWYRQVP